MFRCDLWQQRRGTEAGCALGAWLAASWLSRRPYERVCLPVRLHGAMRTYSHFSPGRGTRLRHRWMPLMLARGPILASLLVYPAAGQVFTCLFVCRPPRRSEPDDDCHLGAREAQRVMSSSPCDEALLHFKHGASPQSHGLDGVIVYQTFFYCVLFAKLFPDR